MKNKRIALNALFVALEAVLCLISNYIIVSIAGININLGLIIIPLAGFILGPIGGLLVGLVNGIFTIIAPATVSIFLSQVPVWTIVICLLKTGLAGLISGFISKLNKNVNFFILLVASLIVPLINTGIFTIACFTCFRSIYSMDNKALVDYIVAGILTVNFLIESLTTILLSPTLLKIINIYKGGKHHEH